MPQVSLAQPMADLAKTKTEEAEALPVLPPGRDNFSLTEAGFQFATIHVKQPVGHTVEDALRPEYWVHHARYLKAEQASGRPDLAGSKIELRTLDHAHYAELYVRAVHENTRVLDLLGEPIYFGPKKVGTAQFDVRWNVGNKGFDVIRQSDRYVVASKLQTREMAQEWIDKTMRH
jgi:hypothetical protein